MPIVLVVRLIVVGVALELGNRSRVRSRARRRICPQCRHPWALSVQRVDSGFRVTCRHCSYARPVGRG